MVELERQNLKENTKIYKRELKRLRKRIEDIVPIDHVGSTVLPYMYGKNIIDILIGAKDMKELEKLVVILSNELGFFPGKNCTGPYRFFASRKEETKAGDIHVHLTLIDSDRYKDFLVLKNYLLKNKKEVKKYSDLKKRLINDGLTVREDYKRIKSEYVSYLLERARKI